MFQRLFGRERTSARALVDGLYGQIVAAARRPVLYAGFGVPDTPLGRYEMISLHLFLFLHRTRDAEGPLADVGQELTDRHFAEIDDALRELGIGDMAVPKRMKKLARMFYGRAQSYGEALDRSDRPALAAALARNVRPDAPSWPQAPILAAYVEAARDALARQPVDAFLAGRVEFADPGTVAGTPA
ncbi:MAG: ubiquinol-cytochrome C chaperone family protein [Rhizobiaceae bacterium]